MLVAADEHPRPDTTLERPRSCRRRSARTARSPPAIPASTTARRRSWSRPRPRAPGTASSRSRAWSAARRCVIAADHGIGPAPATQKQARFGWAIGEIDVIELNEAFASQALAVLRQLGLPDDAAHVNPNGGAIALGHPLGMSGARISGTAALELKDRGAKRARDHVHRRRPGHRRGARSSVARSRSWPGDRRQVSSNAAPMAGPNHFPVESAVLPESPRLILVIVDPQTEWKGGGQVGDCLAEWTKGRGAGDAELLHPGHPEAPDRS